MEHLKNLGEPVEIEGVTFRITKLGYKSGRALFVRLMKIIGPALADMAERAPTLAALGLKLNGLDAGGLAILIEKVSEPELDYFAQKLGDVSRYSTDGSNFPVLDEGKRELLFAGRQLFALKWMRAALEVQYGDFLSVLAPPEGSATEGDQTPSESPNPS